MRKGTSGTGVGACTPNLGNVGVDIAGGTGVLYLEMPAVRLGKTRRRRPGEGVRGRGCPRGDNSTTVDDRVRATAASDRRRLGRSRPVRAGSASAGSGVRIRTVARALSPYRQDWVRTFGRPAPGGSIRSREGRR